MAIQATSKKNFSIPSDHLEEVSRGISALTIDPYKNALYYFFPFVGAFFSNGIQLKSDPTQQAMMPTTQADPILAEIQNLTDCAQIHRQVVPYIALNHRFSSYGGSCSITKPALFIPDQHLFRRGGKSPFGQERPEENLANEPWVFSDNQTRFLLARELAQIKENNAMVRIAIKVAVLAALFTIYASPFGWPLGLSLFIGTLGIYITSERHFQAKADVAAVHILRNRQIANPSQVAIETLEKIRHQNLYRKEHNQFASYYITAHGNNLLELTRPSLTSRIQRLQTIS